MTLRSICTREFVLCPQMSSCVVFFGSHADIPRLSEAGDWKRRKSEGKSPLSLLGGGGGSFAVVSCGGGSLIDPHTHNN